jgi:AMP-binding enzyme
MNADAVPQPKPSIIRGIPLGDEPGLGALTLPGYLREVTTRFGEREALVMHHRDGAAERWSYADLWDRAMELARALVACGVGRDSRVGVLMTNRPEWIASMFGVSLAGGVAVALSTFSTPAELEYLLDAACVSILLFERDVLKKDFAAMLLALEPGIGRAEPGRLASPKFPFLRRLAMVAEGPASGAIEGWAAFLAHAGAVSPALVEATGGCRGSVLFVGLHRQAQRHTECPSRRFHPVLALAAHTRPAGRRSLLECQRLLLVRQFRHGVGRHAVLRRLPAAAADLRGGRFTQADGNRACNVGARLAAPVGTA